MPDKLSPPTFAAPPGPRVPGAQGSIMDDVLATVRAHELSRASAAKHARALRRLIADVKVIAFDLEAIGQIEGAAQLCAAIRAAIREAQETVDAA